MIRAKSDAGEVEFQERLTIDTALKRAAELRAADFRQITLVNVLSGVEISDPEGLIPESSRRY
jgi:hypothetical protein